MRIKMISKTYLRDINKYDFTFYNHDDLDCYISVKKIIETPAPFIITSGLCVIDNGYYIVEIIPKSENYALRIYLNDKKEILEYYFDISLGNGIDSDSLIPYYDDLYLDVIMTNDEIELVDENDLQDALDKGKITKQHFDLAYQTANQIIDELKAKSNRFVNMNLDKYIK